MFEENKPLIIWAEKENVHVNVTWKFWKEYATFIIWAGKENVYVNVTSDVWRK
jgi:hypothetical protein